MQVFLCRALFDGDALLLEHGIVFQNKIIKIAPNAELRQYYGDQCIDLGNHKIIFPGLINAHVHLEFSANRTTLEYGHFMPWLQSVIANRDELINECDDECIEDAIRKMLDNGITAFGAVSSYGFDLEAAAAAPQKVVFFNELIGSDPAMADALYANFQERLFASQEIEREGFYPAIAIHSPYSVHHVLIKKALQYAKTYSLRTTAHFMESPEERQWLDSDHGGFKPFFESFLKQSRAANRPIDFLNAFAGVPTLFTHAVQANEEELDIISSQRHTVIHCPISNRLLGNGALALKSLDRKNIRWICATDGLSSNYDLNLIEEMKAALFIHCHSDLQTLSEQLWQSVTSKAADALHLNCGSLKTGYDADFVVASISYPINEQLLLHMLLQPLSVDAVYINGKQVKGSS